MTGYTQGIEPDETAGIARQGEVHKLIDAAELAHTFEDETHHADLSPYAVEDWAAGVLFWMMGAAVFLQFFTRYVLNNSLSWTEEIATYLLVGLVFVGSSMCVRLSRHIQVDILFRFLPARPARVLATAVDLVRTAFFFYLAHLYWRYVGIVGHETMITVELPKGLLYYTVLAGCVLMALRSLQVTIVNLRRGYSVLERPEAYDSAGSV